MIGIQMVRFGSPDLRTSALGVKRVRGSGSPWSRGRPKPKKAQNCQHSKICNQHKLNIGPIPTDFDETRWDLIPPMCSRSSGGSGGWRQGRLRHWILKKEEVGGRANYLEP